MLAQSGSLPSTSGCPDLGHVLQSQGLGGLPAQHNLLHLAAGGHRIALHELEVRWDLLVTDLALAVVAYLLLGELHAFPRPDHRQQFFAEESVWHTEHLSVSDPGMADEERLDLRREEVLTATNDHVFEPTHDVEVALRVHGGKITRMQPAVSVNRLRSLLRHLVVAHHRHKATIAQFAALPDRHHRARRRIDDLDIDMRQRFAHRRRFQLARLLWHRRGKAATAFGLTEDDEDICCHACFHLFHQKDRNRGATSPYNLERREIILLKVRMLEHRQYHCRSTTRDMTAFAANYPHGFDGIKG